MKNLLKILLAVLSLAFWSCQGNEEQGYEQSAYQDIQTEESGYEQAEQAEEGSEEVSKSTETVADTERKLIKNGRLGFQTDDLTSTHQRILGLAKKFNAYIASDEMVKSREQVVHNITIRIPAKGFDELVGQIGEGVKEFDYKDISVRDVTAEFLDVEARIKTKKELENRYIAILQKANTVANMLEVEEKLGEVRGEIESMEGRLKYLKNQVAYSTLEVSFYKEFPYEGDGFGKRIVNSFGQGWQGFIFFIVGLVNLWPFLILIGIAIWFFRSYKKRKKESA